MLWITYHRWNTTPYIYIKSYAGDCTYYNLNSNYRVNPIFLLGKLSWSHYFAITPSSPVSLAGAGIRVRWERLSHASAELDPVFILNVNICSSLIFFDFFKKYCIKTFLPHSLSFLVPLWISHLRGVPESPHPTSSPALASLSPQMLVL